MRIQPAAPLDESRLAELSQVERWAAAERAIWEHRPEVMTAANSLSEKIRETGTITPRLFELLRLRLGFHNQCRACMTVRYATELISEAVVCSLEKPYEAPDLADSERAALHFADLFATDHLAIDEAVLDGLRQYFNEGEIVELSAICAVMVGFGRISAVWRAYNESPLSEWPEEGERFAPWTSDVSIDGSWAATTRAKSNP